MSGARARQSGFTLLELVVVLLLISVAIGVTVPALSRLRGDDGAAEVAQEVARLFSRARMAAADRGVAVRVALEAPSGRYTVVMGGFGEDSVAQVASGMLPVPHGMALDIARPIAVFTFHPLGLAEGDTVRIVGADGEVRVVLDPWSGRTRAVP